MVVVVVVVVIVIFKGELKSETVFFFFFRNGLRSLCRPLWSLVGPFFFSLDKVLSSTSRRRKASVSMFSIFGKNWSDAYRWPDGESRIFFYAIQTKLPTAMGRRV